MNLVNDPWIPVLSLKNEFSFMSIRDVFKYAHEIKCIKSRFLGDYIAGVRFLTSFLIWYDEEIDLENLNKPFSENLLNKLERDKDKFNLFGEDRFYQIPFEEKNVKSVSVSKIFPDIPSATNVLWHEKVFDEEAVYSPEACALAIIRTHSYLQGEGEGRGGRKPGICGNNPIFVLPEGRNLSETLRFYQKEFTEKEKGIPFWIEKKQFIPEDVKKDWSPPPCFGLTWFPRKIYLLEEKPKEGEICTYWKTKLKDVCVRKIYFSMYGNKFEYTWKKGVFNYQFNYGEIGNIYGSVKDFKKNFNDFLEQTKFWKDLNVEKFIIFNFNTNNAIIKNLDEIIVFKENDDIDFIEEPYDFYDEREIVKIENKKVVYKVKKSVNLLEDLKFDLEKTDDVDNYGSDEEKLFNFINDLDSIPFSQKILIKNSRKEDIINDEKIFKLFTDFFWNKNFILSRKKLWFFIRMYFKYNFEYEKGYNLTKILKILKDSKNESIISKFNGKGLNYFNNYKNYEFLFEIMKISRIENFDWIWFIREIRKNKKN